MSARRFEAAAGTITRDLQSVLTKMEATSLKINQDLFTNEAAIVFDRGGKRYTFSCDKWDHPMDNLRAAQLTIDYLYRALETYGTARTEQDLEAVFDRLFLGFEATPDDSSLLLSTGAKDWWEILGVVKDASKAAIVNAYKALAKVHHPDSGGNADDFKRLRAAYEQGLEVAK